MMSRSAHSAIKPTNTALTNESTRFRILVVGKSGVGKTTLIAKTFNAEAGSITSTLRVGISDINKPLVSKSDDRFVLHDSMGFEPGESVNFAKVERFIEERRKMPELKDRLHAIWHCVATPPSGARIFGSHDEDFLRLDLAGVPVIVVFTKFDLLISEAERISGDQDDNFILAKAAENFDQGCGTKMKELMRQVDRDYPYVQVTIHNREMLRGLVQITGDAIGIRDCFARPPSPNLQIPGDPIEVIRLAWAIAQRVSPDLKITVSMGIGAQENWIKIISKRFLSRLNEIHEDIVKIWNFPDPEEYLTCQQEGGFRSKLFKGIEDLSNILHDHKNILAQLMGYIADLVILMDIISVARHQETTTRSPITIGLLDEALGAYYAGETCKQIHQDILAYLVTLQGTSTAGVPQGPDVVLDRMTLLIKAHCPSIVQPHLRVYSTPVALLGPAETQGSKDLHKVAKLIEVGKQEIGSLPHSLPVSPSTRVLHILERFPDKLDKLVKQFSRLTSQTPGGSTVSPPWPIPRLSLNSSTVKLLKDGKKAGGGSYDIFQGIHHPTKQFLAMRCPRLSNKELQHIIVQFHEEAQTWSSFDHINILPFLGIAEIKGATYMISPWMDNGDLAQFLQYPLTTPNGTSNLQQNTLVNGISMLFDEGKIISEIAAGVAYLHSNNYVHGDIKAQNVLLTEDGSAQICDFGLTKIAGEFTSTVNRGAGSVRWMAPELHDGLSKSPETDVYAFAMTMVEVLTRKVPYADLKNSAAIIKAVSNNKRPSRSPLMQQGRDFSILWNVASHCWQSEPAKRLGMSGVLAALKFQKEVPGAHI